MGVWTDRIWQTVPEDVMVTVSEYLVLAMSLQHNFRGFDSTFATSLTTF
jgi:hypothetical protein